MVDQELTPEQIKQMEAKQNAAMMKRQVIASDAILKDFNWVMNMPMD